MQLKTPRIRQVAGGLSAKTLEMHAHAILLVPSRGADLSRLPHGTVLHERLTRAGHKLDGPKPFVTDLPNPAGTRLALAGIKPELSPHQLLGLARQLVAVQLRQNPARLVVFCYGLKPPEAARACEALVAAALAAAFSLPDYKSKPEKRRALSEIVICGARPEDRYARTVAEARGNNLARYLTALPPNELSPGTYRKRVERLARAYGWKTGFFDMKKLKAEGAGAFLAVAQGSPEPDAGILRLRYTPKKGPNSKRLVGAGRTARTPERRGGLALVGKGICFDTGGTNLKSARHMHGMHEDMEGSAVALGTLLALTELKVDFPVDCWLALAQNHIGPRAYRQNEVVRAASGTTIEVVHTDAEGRMILADALYFAARERPRLIIDYATLTGACVGALSTRVSGVFTNRERLWPALIEAGKESGERVWPFPLHADYEDALKSGIADIKQCTLDSDADHILAALFLKRFLSGDPDWVHVDLSAGNHKGGLAHVPTDITGFGVRFTLNLLLDRKVLGQSERSESRKTES